MASMVVDTSALVATILGEPTKAQLVRLTRGANLLAPGSQSWELGNALSAMFKRGSLRLEDAQAALEIFHKIPIQSVDVDLAKALEMADALSIYAYDAYMIVCAMDCRAPLLTLDRALARQARSMNVVVPEI